MHRAYLVKHGFEDLELLGFIERIHGEVRVVPVGEHTPLLEGRLLHFDGLLRELLRKLSQLQRRGNGR
jgi:hypothetical protein